jgi:hypothetical protein
LRSNKTTGKLSEMLYFLCSRMSIIFLNKLKIVEITKKKRKKRRKNQNKTSMAKVMGPFRYSQVPS